jgi:hypothetical protein
MSGFQGVRIDAARQTAGLMRTYADELETQVREITGQLPECHWTGPDAERFSGDWSGMFSVDLKGAVEELRAHAAKLSARAERQSNVSRSG